jgi:hypothetical protein
MNVTLSYVGCDVNVTLTEDEIYITRVGEYVTRYNYNTVTIVCSLTSMREYIYTKYNQDAHHCA